jgi:hypothetical protein
VFHAARKTTTHGPMFDVDMWPPATAQIALN